MLSANQVFLLVEALYHLPVQLLQKLPKIQIKRAHFHPRAGRE